MSDPKIDLILHPERFRILSYFTNEKRSYTAQELAKRLPTIPPATLYRHLNRLVEGGILHIVEEHSVGNRTLRERSYGLIEGMTQLHPSDVEQASREDFLQYVTVFLSTVLGRFNQYANHQEKPEPTLLQWSLHLTDQEHNQFIEALLALIQTWSEQATEPERRNRLFSLLAFPEEEELLE